VTPKYIVKVMNAELLKNPDSIQLTRLQVASHLQQYRQEIQKALATSPESVPSPHETTTETAEASLPVESTKEQTPIYSSSESYNSFAPSLLDDPSCYTYPSLVGREADAFLSLEFYPSSPSSCCDCQASRGWSFAEPGVESLSCVWTSN